MTEPKVKIPIWGLVLVGVAMALAVFSELERARRCDG